jgi:hypothetical protein
MFFLNCSLMHANDNLVELTPIDVSGKQARLVFVFGAGPAIKST